MSDELRDKLEALEACPFCGDPMRVTNAGDFRHVDAGGCLIGQLSWQADERYISKWNTHAKHLVVADGGEGVAWRDEDAEPQWQPSLPTSDAPTLVDEPIHADQITAPGRYMAPVDALGDPEILERIAISMDQQGMPLSAAKIREAAATIAALEAENERLRGEYICKCGLRVEPHRCADTKGDL